MKKILTILILFICLTNVNTIHADTEHNTTYFVSSNIKYDGLKRNGEQITVSNIAVKCNDYYYGVVVEDGVNFSNSNNYFTTSKGLKVAVTNEKLKSGVNKDDGYTSIQEIEKGVFLVVNGPDEETVNNVFKKVYKTSENAYKMFNHNISNEWTKEVIITPTVVSFSDGVDTVYIYHNPGSISEGSYKGRIQPTVFFKELRGIDIPITYPEDVDDLSTYVPYGTQRYEHYVTNGYTPYSAYDNEAGYIILAKDDDTIKNLFEMDSDLKQPLSEIELKTRSVDNYLFSPEQYNLDEVKEYAKDIINSDNRYHFGIVEEGDGKQKDYYFENIDGIEESFRENGGIEDNGIKGVLVRPSIKTINYLFTTNPLEYTPLKTYFIPIPGDKSYKEGTIKNHGASATLINYVKGTNIDSMNTLNEFALEGDYAYLFTGNTFVVYKHVWTTRFNLHKREKDNRAQYGECYPDQNWENYLVQHYNNVSHQEIFTMYSCSLISGLNSLQQQYKRTAYVKY